MKSCSSCGATVSPGDERCSACGAQLEDRADKLIGTTLVDKYRIEERLGSGGMCEVYRARHLVMDKQVAVKVLKPELAADPRITQRFEQEARAASRIHHPHAINVTDYGIADDDTPFIVMEFVNGLTLGELLRKEGAFTIERAANILRQVCGALEAAHGVGVIHRDIKPDNIIIAQYDESDWVEVVDFGVAKIQEDVNRRSALTGANIIVGTPRYMSPEQCDEKPVDARSDIYSLGVVLYEMLSGEAPFPGDSSTRLLMAHASQPPVPLREKRPDIPPEIEAVVMRALEKDPARRPQTATEFAQQFEEAAGLGQPVQARAGRGGAFSRISVPLGEEEQVARAQVADAPPSGVPPASPPALEDEATLVRTRPKNAAISPSIPSADTPPNQRVDTPYNMGAAGQQGTGEDPAMYHRGQLRYATPPQGTTYVSGSYDSRGRSGNAWVIGVVVLLLAVAGVAAYLVFGNRQSSTNDAVIDAQQAITEATARIDMLPTDHALRSYLKDLALWQGEMRAYQQVHEFNPQIVEKAELYKQRAEDITKQARAALASLPSNSAPAQGATSPAQAPKDAAAPGEAAGTEEAKEDKESAEEAEEPEEEPEEKAEGNKNANRPRRAAPPVIEPIKPAPAETKPANSNKPKNDNPPPTEKVNVPGNG